MVMGLITMSPLVNPASAGSVNSSGSTTSYPTNIAHGSCATYSGYIYCVGGGTGLGSTSAVYFAPVSSSGVGAWTSTTRYPTTENYQSCATYSGYIYCVGGYIGGGNVLSAVYFAPVSSSGVGAWTSTTRYPTTIDYQSCVIYSGYIYCVGGNAPSTPSGFGGAYFAPVSSSGVGAWTSTTSYPAVVTAQSCATDSGYIYCVGGQPVSSTGYTSAVYYADLTSNFNNYVATSSTSSSSISTTTSSTSTSSSVKATTTTSVTCSPSSLTEGASSTCTATISGNSPTGTVTWTSAGLGNFSPAPTCTLSGGACAVTYVASTSAPTISITASYGGDSSNAGSSGTYPLNVARASTSTSSTSSTTPEFPTRSLAVVALVVIATVAVLSRRSHARQPARIS